MHVLSECCPYGDVAVCLCNEDYFYITHFIFFALWFFKYCLNLYV